MQWLCIFVIYLSSLSVKNGQQGTVQGCSREEEGIAAGHLRTVCNRMPFIAASCWLINIEIFSNRFSFCHTWQHEALETFCLPSIMLAGKAKPLMVTPGCIHAWSFSCFSNITDKIAHMHMFNCINAQIHCCSVHTEIWLHLRVSNNVFFQPTRNIRTSSQWFKDSSALFRKHLFSLIFWK